jgi:arginase family enzyme
MTADITTFDVPLVQPGYRLFDGPLRNVSDVKMGQIGVVGMPSDWTHSSRLGTRFGPAALRKATTLMQSTRPQGAKFDPDTGLATMPATDWMVDCGDAEVTAQDVNATTEAIAAMTEVLTVTGAIPLALGGDHYNSFPACLGYSRGLAKRMPNTHFGYIQIDGHLDFSDRLGAWGSHNHATNARRISELPNINVSNMVWVGIAGWVDSGELALIEKQGGRVFSASDVHNLGVVEVMQQALAHAMQGCDELYLSIDIDAMDAGYLPGTGSIVHSGITPRQYYDMLEALAEAPLGGLDIVEVSPPLDPSERTEFLAAEMLFRILHRFRTRPVNVQ